MRRFAKLGGKVHDMTDAIIENYHAHHLNALVCLGGGGTQKNALRLKQEGLNIITLPKTIDNDVALTDVTFGFATALGIATESIDRYGVMVAAHGDQAVPVPLEEVAGNRRLVPLDHPWIEAARQVGTSLGD